MREFAHGLEEIFVIEEKRPFLEMFAKNVLYGMANAPRIVGKFDEEDKELLPHYGEFESDVICRALTRRLSQKARIESAEAWIARLDEIHSRSKLPTAVRTAWYCSGCPHNSSTQALEGSVVSAGIGCHTMAMWMDRNVVMGTHMGAEGAQWIGMTPFTDTRHIFQNMGDGTYAHSGSLAIRYAASANANITFKVLRNAHTSMTGGQEIMGAHPVGEMVSEFLALGVKKVIVTSDEPESLKGVSLPGGTEVWHRDRLDEAQRALAATPGTTVLLHDQECAAELRRARSRGKAEEPKDVIVINERVCEGCGDCGVKSNCMSVEPVQTEFGRKTRIHQSSCNKDYSCVKGFCPSFLTITPNPEPAAAEGGKKKKKKGRIPALERALPEPVSKVDASFGFGIHVMGIGGTGSVTVVATIANAARLEGKHVIGLDQTGLAQKGGAVISDIKITNAPFDGSNKISDGRADLYLGFDILNATDPKNLDKCNPERTIAVVSTTQTPTGKMVTDRHVLFPATSRLTAGIDKVTRKADNVFLDGQAMAEGLFGDAMATNNFMVGVAFQAGTIPLKAESIEAAIKAKRRRRRHEPGRLPLGPHGGGRPRLRRGRDRQRRRLGKRGSGRSAAVGGGTRHRRCRRREGRNAAPARSACPRPDRLPGRGLRQALRRGDQAGGGGRAARRAGQERAGGSRRALPVQADGLQGRVRSGAPAHRPGLPGRSSTPSSSTATRSSTTWRRRSSPSATR